MGSNEAALAPYYSGDAAMLIEDNPNIGFVIPKSGTNIFVDSMCIPADSLHKEEALEYINFMCRIDIAFSNTLAVGYSTPIPEVRELLSSDISQDPIYYPDEEIMRKSQSFTALPDEINMLVDQLWIGVKTGDSDKTLALICVLAVFLLTYLFAIIYNKRKKLK